jgi:thiol-disulfide isomerase/thioredoxin
MAKTLSTMLPLGTTLPQFELTDTVSGKTICHTDFPEDHGVLVMFICNHCPYVIHLQDAISRMAQECAAAPLSIIAINSNDVEKYPQDGPDAMKALAEELSWSFPYCLDASQELAKTFQAACTPDFYVFGKAKTLCYRGQFDDSRPKSDAPITGNDLRDALTAMLAGDPPPQEQKPSMGCNIKWKEGNAPSYFPAS